MDAHPDRPSLATIFDDYLDILPGYQGVPLDSIECTRALFGFFPSYKNSPLKPGFDRVLQLGDSSGLQSPLSFGGFGAMLRHLPRLNAGLNEALAGDFLDRACLTAMVPYQPSLSVTWLFQRAMSVRVEERVRDPNVINRVLSTNFAAMEKMGLPVLKPFLQDVVRFGGLSRTMLSMAATDPKLVLEVVQKVGPGSIAEWYLHFMSLAAFDVSSRVGGATQGSVERLIKDERQRYFYRRFLEALEFGAGLDLKEEL